MLRKTYVSALMALAAMTLVSSLVEQHVLSRWAGRASLPGLLYPFGQLAVLAITWRSAWHVFRRGGVAWRDTLYRVDDLREGSRLELF